MSICSGRSKRASLAQSGQGREWVPLECLRSQVDFQEVVKVPLARWLCFARFPLWGFSELTVPFVHFPGTGPDQLGPTGERFLDNRRFDGPLPLALEDNLQAVIGSMHLGRSEGPTEASRSGSSDFHVLESFIG
jgi:hypothetical protein